MNHDCYAAAFTLFVHQEYSWGIWERSKGCGVDVVVLNMDAGSHPNSFLLSTVDDVVRV